MPGAVGRWTGKKDLSWQPLRPDLVMEVGYEAMEGDRFRHTRSSSAGDPTGTRLPARTSSSSAPFGWM
jgi:hypothetical protein